MPIKTEEEVSRRTRDLYERALGAIERKNFPSAIGLLLDALALEPEFLQAHKVLRATQVKQFGDKGLRTIPVKIWAFIVTLPAWIMSEVALKSKPKESMTGAYRILNHDPTSIQGLDLLIRTAEALQLPQVGVLAAEAAVTAWPKSLSFMGTLASLYRASDQPEKAQDVYERMLELRPYDPDIIREMKDTTTLVHMKGSRIEEADTYRDMMKDTKEAVSLEQQAKVIRSKEMIEQLIAEVQEKLELQPENFSLIRQIADLYLQKGDFDRAEEALQKAMAHEGGDPALEKMLGDIQLRRVDNEIKTIRTELEQRTGDPALKQQLQELRGRRGLLQLEECQRRVKRYPNDLAFRFELGILFYQAGRVKEALQEFQQSQRSPQHRVQSLNYLGLCFREQRLYDLALNQLQKAKGESMLMDATKKEILYNLGETYELMGKRDDALQQFKEIYEVDINFCDVAQKLVA